jgi:hypothetical protein
MQKTGDRAGRGITRGVVAAAAAAAAVVTMLPVSAAAAESAKAPQAPAVVEHEAGKAFDRIAARANKGGVGTNSAGSGARSGDFTQDGTADILARQASNGALKVYPHSGAFQGTATYRAAITINSGWGSMRWIGQGDLTGDGNPDVVYVDAANTMRVAPHSGTFNGTGTLTSSVAISTGWSINDLITTADLDGNGLDDVIARRRGTDTTYIYWNDAGLNGFSTLSPAEELVTGTAVDIEEVFADFTGDGVPDLLFVQNDGVMGLFDSANGGTYAVSYGWGIASAFVVTDVNRDGWNDVLARRRSDGALLAYRHSTNWAPAGDGTAFGTLLGGVSLGAGWNTNNVIS